MIKGVGLSSNVYILGKKNLTLVDTGARNVSNRLLNVFEKAGFDSRNVEKVVITHSHFDHVGGLSDIVKTGKATVMCHRSAMNRLRIMVGANLIEAQDDCAIETELGRLKVLYTPGHTSDSICLYDERTKTLFSGDTVFGWGAFGRTNLDTGSKKDLLASLGRLSALEVDVLLPGHGEPIFKGAKIHIRLAYENALRA